MKLLIILAAFAIVLFACSRENSPSGKADEKSRPMEISDLYTRPETETIYSTSVSDSFKIFKSLPQGYSDSASLYPLIIVLDANGYFEAVVSELKLATLTLDLPKCIVVGIGYRGFWAMDSLRNRDLTYPIAPPEDEFSVSGGGQKFKNFIDQELLPKLIKDYRVDQKKMVIMGHSLGGYFVLYYLFDSLEKGVFNITNVISASPSLDFHRRYIFDLEKKSSITQGEPPPFCMYLSMGSLDRDTTQAENVFLDFKNQLALHHYKGAKMKLQEFGNFEHMDAALPGFIKGLVFVFEK